jgi:dCMP deaminase
MNWDEYFINIAEQVKLKSKDIKTQIGVVVVGKDNSIVSTGYNSFARGINDDIDERQERPEKYFWFEHAERNAIYNAARIGVSTLDTTMYMTCGMSCSDCARAIINSGISKIVLRQDRGAIGDRWNESAIRSMQMFKEAGVIVEYYD